jgi:predicted nucleic acid-binding Zn ribbon protein
MSDEPLRECPECGGELRRVINSVGIVFKGSGFYVTDSREHVNGSAAGNGKGESKSEKPKSESQTSSKTDKSDKSE